MENVTSEWLPLIFCYIGFTDIKLKQIDENRIKSRVDTKVPLPDLAYNLAKLCLCKGNFFLTLHLPANSKAKALPMLGINPD
jgi:hypothetical protein